MVLSVPAGVSAQRFGEKRVLALGPARRGGGQPAARRGVELRVGDRVPRPDDLRLPLRVRQRAHRGRAHRAAVAARPHDGRRRRHVVAGVGDRRAARRHARARVHLAHRDSRLRRRWRCSARPCSGCSTAPRPTTPIHRRSSAARRQRRQRVSLTRGLDARADRRARRLRTVHRDLLRAERGPGGVRPRRRGGRRDHQHRLPDRDRREPRRRRARGSLQQAGRARRRLRPAGASRPRR